MRGENVRRGPLLDGLTFSVDGKVYVVRVEDRICRDQFLFAETDFVEQVIRVERGLKEDRLRETLLHEILHCIFQSRGETEWNEDERLICTIASGLNQVLSSSEVLLALFPGLCLGEGATGDGLDGLAALGTLEQL